MASFGGSATPAEILTLYTTPGHPTAFSGVVNVARYHHISPRRARDILDQLEAYSTHREYKRPRVYNPYYVRKRRDLIQTDLIDVSSGSRRNRGVKYLMLVIDVFTKFVWVYPLKNKTGKAVSAALKTFLRECGERPRVIDSDAGKEYYNELALSVLRDWGVEKQKALGTAKAAVAERANKSIQGIVSKYLTTNASSRYIHELPKLVLSYNLRPHRTLKGLTPDYADRPENEEEVLAIHDARYKSVPRQQPRFKVGDIVRVKIESKILTPASRSYNPQFNRDYYVVERINTRVQIPMYHLRAAEDDEEILGGFYANELTRVSPDFLWKIERVLQQRGRGKKRELFVKWEGFSDRWNDWIPAADLQQLS